MKTPLLKISQLYKRFDGVCVADDVNLHVFSREVRFIIGPNGAGKTSLFKLITGFLRQDSGSISFESRKLDGLPPYKRQKRGIAQAFQTPRVIRDLTVGENLMLALNPTPGLLRAFRTLRYSASALQTMAKILDKIDLAGMEDEPVSNLSHGGLKKLDVGCALIQSPKLLLLDEPTAGLTEQESRDMVELIMMIQNDMAVIIIEHDMGFVRDVNAPVTVLNRGRIVRQGLISELENDAVIQEIYFGNLND